MRRSLMLLLACLVACGPSAGPAAPEDPRGLVIPGTLTVGLEPGYLPFEMKTAGDELIGFDVELARELAKRLGLEVKFVSQEWSGIITSLNTRKFDVIISGLSVTEERKRVIGFSEPYYEVGQAVLLAKKHAVTVKSYKDLDREEMVIVSQESTTGAEAVKTMLPKAKLKLYDHQSNALQEVVQGRADAMVFDHPAILIAAKRHPEQTVALSEQFTKEPIGIGLRKDATELKRQIDEALKAIKADGTYQKLVDKYFVEMAWLDALPKKE